MSIFARITKLVIRRLLTRKMKLAAVTFAASAIVGTSVMVTVEDNSTNTISPIVDGFQLWGSYS